MLSSPELNAALNLAVRIETDVLDRFDVEAPELTETLAIYRKAMDHVPGTLDVDFEALTVTATEVEDLIDRAVELVVRSDVHDRVRWEVADRLGRRAIRAMRAAAPDVIDGMAGPFNAAAVEFTEIYAKLPPGYEDTSRLVEAGPQAVQDYHEAHAATVALDEIREIRDDLAVRCGAVAAGGRVEEASRYCEIRNAGTAQRVLENGGPIKNPGPLGIWGSLLETDGVLRLRTLPIAEHRDYVAGLDRTEGYYESGIFNGFKAAKFVEA